MIAADLAEPLDKCEATGLPAVVTRDIVIPTLNSATWSADVRPGSRSWRHGEYRRRNQDNPEHLAALFALARIGAAALPWTGAGRSRKIPSGGF